MKKLRAIIFDCDGVVINSATDIANAVNATLDHFSMKKIPEKTLVTYTGDGARMLIARAVSASTKANGLNPSDVPPQELETILKWYIDYYYEHSIECTMLYPQFGELLSALSEAGIHTAVVSNKPQPITHKIMDYFGIVDFFDVLIGPEQLKHIKPDPEGIALAVKEINKTAKTLPGGRTFTEIKPEETMMVGDSDVDIIAGKAFGAHTCGVTGGFGNKEKLAKAEPEITVEYAGDLRGVLGL